MRVLLLRDVKGLGRRMEVPSVSPGYARNFLIPKGFARPFDKAAEGQKKEVDAAEAAFRASLAEQSKRLAGLTLTLTLPTGLRGEVFAGLHARDIERALREQGIQGERLSVLLGEPIKEPGEYSAKVRLGHGVEARLTVSVRAGPKRT